MKVFTLLSALLAMCVRVLWCDILCTIALNALRVYLNINKLPLVRLTLITVHYNSLSAFT